MRPVNVRVDLIYTEDDYQLEMSCDLPGSYYAQSIHRINMMNQMSIRLSAFMILPRRNRGIIAPPELFSSVALSV